MNNLDPIILSYLKEQIKNGKKIDVIIKDIETNYYHINNGPDLRDYQNECSEDCINYFKHGNIYQILWCCGLGKTIMSLSISKKMNINTLLIGIPSIILLNQFYNEIQNYYPNTTIFTMVSKSDVDELNDKKLKETYNNDIKKYLKSNTRYKIVLTTYHSSKKICEATNEINFKFDLGIFDEVHHLLSKKSKKFKFMLDILCNKKLLLTATPKMGNETRTNYSLESSKPFIGKSNIKTVKWAIDNNYITNYNIVILNFDNLKNIQNYDMLLDKYEDVNFIISAYMALLSIDKGISKKILIYANSIINSQHINELIKYFLDNNYFPQLHNKITHYELSSKNTMEDRTNTLCKFKTEDFSIMSSVKLFGEGFDFPKLDTVLFAEHMSSEVRIIQSALRPCRLDKINPNKVANILLPICEEDDSKIKQILQEMKSIDRIIDKIVIANTTNFNKKNIYNKKINKENIFNDKYCIKILQKIELEYLNEEYRFKEINKENVIQNYTEILLTPVSDNSFKNFYKSVLSSDIKRWGFKTNKIWKKINENNLIIFVEKSMITFGLINNKEENNELSNTVWNDEQYKYIVKFTLIKRIKLNKKEFIKNIGYAEKFNLQGSIFYKKNNTTYIENL